MIKIWSFTKKLFKVSIEKFLSPGLRAIHMIPMPRLRMRALRHVVQSLILSNILLSGLLLLLMAVKTRDPPVANITPKKPAEKL